MEGKGRNNLKGRNNSSTFPYKFSRKLNSRYSPSRISIFTTSDPDPATSLLAAKYDEERVKLAFL